MNIRNTVSDISGFMKSETLKKRNPRNTASNKFEDFRRILKSEDDLIKADKPALAQSTKKDFTAGSRLKTLKGKSEDPADKVHDKTGDKEKDSLEQKEDLAKDKPSNGIYNSFKGKEIISDVTEELKADLNEDKSFFNNPEAAQGLKNKSELSNSQVEGLTALVSQPSKDDTDQIQKPLTYTDTRIAEIQSGASKGQARLNYIEEKINGILEHRSQESQEQNIKAGGDGINETLNHFKNMAEEGILRQAGERDIQPVSGEVGEEADKYLLSTEDTDPLVPGEANQAEDNSTEGSLEDFSQYAKGADDTENVEVEAENKKDDNFRNLQADSEITSGAENTSEKPDGNPVNLHGGFERPGSLENNFQIKTETADFKNEIMKQVLETAKVLTDGEKSEMTMELKPDGLGKLTLKVITEQGMVFAKISAENSQVKGIIESNMDLLRDTLEKQGMILNGIDVSVGQDSGNDTGSEGFLPYGNKRNPEASEILSELDISGGGKHHLLKNPYEPDMGSIDFRA